MDIFFELIFKFVFKWFNRIVLGTPMSMWSILDWAVFSVVVLILLPVLYLFLRSYFYSGKVAFKRKKRY